MHLKVENVVNLITPDTKLLQNVSDMTIMWGTSKQDAVAMKHHAAPTLPFIYPSSACIVKKALCISFRMNKPM